MNNTPYTNYLEGGGGGGCTSISDLGIVYTIYLSLLYIPGVGPLKGIHVDQYHGDCTISNDLQP